MRRFLAILLLGVINFSLVTPAVFAQASPQLPPCCRLSGKHKCALKRAIGHQTSGASISSIGERCPFSAPTGATGLSLHSSLLTMSRVVFDYAPAVLASQKYSQHLAAASFDHAHYKRGPPDLLA